MTVIADHLRRELEVAFCRACEQLTQARLRNQEKDTPHNRSVVRVCRAQIDRVLDMYLELGCAARV